LKSWYQRVSDSKLNPSYDAKRTIKRWEQKIINYFKTGITNGFAEGINNKNQIDKANRLWCSQYPQFKRRNFYVCYLNIKQKSN